MPDKEFRDYLSGGSTPSDDEIILFQPNPADGDPEDRLYIKRSWLVTKNAINADRQASISVVQITADTTLPLLTTAGNGSVTIYQNKTGSDWVITPASGLTFNGEADPITIKANSSLGFRYAYTSPSVGDYAVVGVMTAVGWADLTGTPYDNADLVAYVADPTNINQDSTHRFVTDAQISAWDAKQNALTFDSTPTASSTNPVYSGGVYDAIQAAKEGVVRKQDVQYATTANVVLTGLQTIDGTLMTTGQSILVKDNTDQKENGVYDVAVGSWTRRADANTGSELTGAEVGVQFGTVNSGTVWRQSTAPVTLGSSNIVWSQFGASTPDATTTTKGKAKLYTSTGSNIDGAMDQNSTTNALALKESTANKDTNNGYVGRDSSGGASVVDATVTSATASTPTFFSAAKKLISMTSALWGNFIAGFTAKSTPVDADFIVIGDSAASNDAKKTTLLQLKTYLGIGGATFTSITGQPNDNSNLYRQLNTPLQLYFKNKTIVWIGDSMVAGAGASPSSLRFSTLVSNRLGATEQNLGIGGATVEKRTPVYSGRTNAIDMGASIPTKTSSIAMIVIAFGLNDVGLNSANYNTTNYETDYTTFLTNSVIGKGYLPSQILIIAPWYITTAGYNAYNASEGVPAADATRHLAFIQATQNVARAFGTMYLNPYDAEYNNDPTLGFLDADNIHRNNTGYEFDAALITNRITTFQIGVNDFSDQDVAGYKRFTTGYKLGGSSGTNTGLTVTPSNAISNYAVNTAAPTSGTNVGVSMQITGKGTGLSGGVKAQHVYFGSDFTADSTNFNALVVGTFGSLNRITSVIGGTGTRQDLVIDANGSASTGGSQVWLKTNGDIVFPTLAAATQLPFMSEATTGRLIKSNTTTNNSNAIFNAWVGQNTTNGTAARANIVLQTSAGNSTFSGFATAYTGIAGLGGKTLVSNETGGTGLVLHTTSANGIDFQVGTLGSASMATMTATGLSVKTSTNTALITLAAGTTTVAQMRWIGGVDPTTPNDGDMWSSTTRNAMGARISGTTMWRSGVLYSNTAAVTLTNTTTETSIFVSGTSALRTLGANLATTGKGIRIKCGGVYTTPLTASLLIKIKIGSVIVAQVTTTAINNNPNRLGFQAEAVILFTSVGATGTVQCDGHINYATPAGTRAFDDLNSPTGLAANAGDASTIDTTTSQIVDVTAQWDAASSSRSAKFSYVTLEILY